MVIISPSANINPLPWLCSILGRLSLGKSNPKNLSKYGSRNGWEFLGNFLFLIYLSVLIVTTAAPVLSTALVTKDLFENKLTSLIFVLLNGWDRTFTGYEMPTGINETISNSFWMYLFNFDFLMFSERFNTPF